MATTEQEQVTYAGTCNRSLVRSVRNRGAVYGVFDESVCAEKGPNGHNQRIVHIKARNGRPAFCFAVRPRPRLTYVLLGGGALKTSYLEQFLRSSRRMFFSSPLI